ncbi:DUF1367 family protein [Alkanindiges illinoisensis]|uniref:DUF1367 family protein n=1 Tax=Alkanindiges illinoisensis TaxID=197183 RepID=A0A4Y7XAI1_9GAMM|nr:DUF1367 family protein [Alkanindiges illinoisensis]TEU23840.1 DUF1367 family protein [Alkanindiges illinoisensis]
MSVDMMMVCNGRALVPATEHDYAIMRQTYRIGQVIKTETKRQADRSLQHHRLYFGGLIGLVKDYWEPQTGLVHPAEVRTAASFCHYLQSKGIALSPEQSQALQQDYLQRLTQKRAAKLINPMPASTAEIHRWIKIECGYYDVVRLPDGTIEKKAKSISFAKMTQAEFNEFYRAAFGVCWRFVLSRHFECEADAENAINRMLDMAA